MQIYYAYRVYVLSRSRVLASVICVVGMIRWKEGGWARRRIIIMQGMVRTMRIRIPRLRHR